MKSFFGKLGDVLTAVRVWTVNIFTLLLLVYVVGGAIYLLSKRPTAVDPAGKILILNPEGIIQDQEVFPTDFDFPFAMPAEKQIQSRDLIRLIRAAAADQALAGVLLDFSDASFAGPSTALAIAEELSALGETGKPVIAYSEVLNTSAYLVAAQADEIYVHPSGAVAINGIGGYRDYTRELTDKLNITIHNYSQGDYKSAVEGMTRSDMSDADKLQREELYGPIWSALKQRMAEGREIEPEQIQHMADNFSVPMLDEGAYDGLAHAQEIGLISGTLTFPELRALMIERFGKSEDEKADRETYPHIAWQAYQQQMEPEDSESEDAVAVVFVEGGIRQGKMGPGVAGSDDIAPLIRKAHEDKSTRAIVLRVNSPGGSVIASDLIRDELAAAKLKDIPVVVSMGDVAASGGVWVSTPADTIFAEPTTITGSIGVAIAFPTLENVFDYIGVNFDGVTTSEHAGWGPALSVDEKLDAIFARWAGSAYQTFINKVAASRDRDPEYIRSIAGGRVWLAPKALELGLIDELGTMEDAIDFAAGQAGLTDFRTHYVVKKTSPLMAVLRELSVEAGLFSNYTEGQFGARVAALFAIFEGVSQPRATVLCDSCLIEML
ncbi:MAG: signal peptide peptidase SppA [Halieaceae bacterium]